MFLGIYFTTFAFGTVPYLVREDQPALILSWTLPGLPSLHLHLLVFDNLLVGHFYPVTEHPDGPTSLRRTAVKGGSHYVVTDLGGHPSESPALDELVIANEFSISPAFILSISKKTKKVVGAKFAEKGFQQAQFDSPSKTQAIPANKSDNMSDKRSNQAQSEQELGDIKIELEPESNSDDDSQEALLAKKSPF